VYRFWTPDDRLEAWFWTLTDRPEAARPGLIEASWSAGGDQESGTVFVERSGQCPTGRSISRRIRHTLEVFESRRRTAELTGTRAHTLTAHSPQTYFWRQKEHFPFALLAPNFCYDWTQPHHVNRPTALRKNLAPKVQMENVLFGARSRFVDYVL